jgi:hypothetical protein
MLSIRGREKSALMMIEPPGNFGRAGVFEIDDGVFVPREMGFVEQGSGAMQQAGELKLHVAANALAVKAGEDRGRRSSVETFVVIENFNFQSIPQTGADFPPPETPAGGRN